MKKKLLTIAMLLCTTTVLATEVKKADKDGDGEHIHGKWRSVTMTSSTQAASAKAYAALIASHG